ncbi:DUF6801 domain-containing protein [Streptomyces sp. NPDC057638]|uniref:DUF6801 domain-containing protein n=1 Tax=Streptomyces sp. NPDC057638 TaxID=3346190 RepID=UPI0036C0591C
MEQRRTRGARSRTTVRGAVAGVAVLVAGVIPGARAADTERTATAELAYACALPAGKSGGGATGDATVRAAVRITATVPTGARVGEPVQPEDVTTALTFTDAARAALTALLGDGVTDVGGATRLTVGLAQEEHTATAEWEGTVAPSVPVPATGELTLTASGLVPTVTAGSSGTLALSAGALAVDLSARVEAPPTGQPSPPGEPDGPAAPSASAPAAASTPSADPGPAPTSAPTGPADPAAGEPRLLALSCAPGKGQDTALATIAIQGDEDTSPSPGPSEPTTGPGDPGDPDAPGDPDGLDVSPPGRAGAARAAARPPTCVGNAANPLALAAYVTGYSNVSKLGAAAEVPVACTQLVDVWKKLQPKPDGLHLLQHATGELDYRGEPVMPPARATFLTYGFMPTTATMEIRQTGPMTVDSDILLAKYTGETLIRVPLTIRLYDVEVNGTPLEVGPNCRTSGPLYSADPDPAQTRRHVVMKGVLKGPGDGYQLVTGGILTGAVTIPPFTGCGVGGEDLDPILSSAVSGPGNYIKQVQGAPCAPGVPEPDPLYCTPDRQPVKVPKPER